MNESKSFSTWEDAVVWLRQQPNQNNLVTDCYYDDPLLSAANRYWNSEEWNAVKTKLSSNTGKALDIGAGRGIASYALAKEGFEVTALEPDPSSIVGAHAIRALATESNLPIHVVENFSENLPFSNDTFDVVFARAVLHHTNNLETACSEFYRVLKPGGTFLGIREHVISKLNDLDLFLEQHPLHQLYGGEHAYLLKQYVSAINQAGFNTIEVISPWQSPLNFAPYTLESLKTELVTRSGIKQPVLNRSLRALLDVPIVWPLLRSILDKIDHRPGRLYSFIAKRN